MVMSRNGSSAARTVGDAMSNSPSIEVAIRSEGGIDASTQLAAPGTLNDVWARRPQRLDWLFRVALRGRQRSPLMDLMRLYRVMDEA